MGDLTLQGKLDYGKVKSLFRKHIRRHDKNKEVVINLSSKNGNSPVQTARKTKFKQLHSQAKRTGNRKHTQQHVHTPHVCPVEVFHSNQWRQTTVKDGRQHPQIQGCLHTPEDGRKSLVCERQEQGREPSKVCG